MEPVKDAQHEGDQPAVDHRCGTASEPFSQRSPAAQLWSLLGGDPSALGRARHVPGPGLRSSLPVQELARASVTACALAATEYAAPGAGVVVDDGRVATAFASDRLVQVDGRTVGGFAPLSRFWRTSDGWVRTHANYPHHRAALLSSLGVRDGTEAEQVRLTARRLATRSALSVEEEVFAAGGLAVAVRSRQEWLTHPQGAACARRPLLTTERVDTAPGLAPQAPGRLRVLDLTRVLAGPVATRTLALLGADVLRIDAPQLPESWSTHADVGIGKRTTRLDLSRAADRATFEELLADAHVVVTGYRPGALDKYGLHPLALAERRPGLVVGRLNAWGDHGPWAGRRGFDSLVQAATGIARIEAETARLERPPEDVPPGALPVQALDHASGYLLAAALLRALSGQRQRTPGSVVVQVVLAHTAHWLLNQERPAPTVPEEVDHAPWLTTRHSALGRLRHARSPIDYAGAPDGWSAPPGVPGEDPPCWKRQDEPG